MTRSASPARPGYLRHGLRAAAGLAGAAALATPAAAQFYGYYGGYSYNVPPPYPGPYGGPRPYGYGPDPYAQPGPRAISPRQVVERLEEQGYEDVSRPRFTGTLYVVQATAPGDIRMRVVVDAVRSVVLNRTVLGDRRSFGLREDLEDERENARPPRPAPERRREVSRTPVQPAPGALGTPADPRLAPGEGAAARAPEPRRPPAARSATRTPTPAPKPGVAPEGSGQPYGVNPEASPRRKPVETKSPVDAKNPPGAPAPRPTVEADRAGKPPVRVIGGVTPPNSGGASAPAPAPQPSQLEALPQPPAAEAPTGLN